MANKKISIIVPCYNEEKVLSQFYSETTRVIEGINNYSFDFIFVDDGSCDKTLEIIKAFAQEDSRIKHVSFSRNFGKEAAMYAGFKHADGDLAVIMDADLQDPPALIPDMIKAIEEGYDSVATKRSTRKGEPVLRSWFARSFYRIINKITSVKVVDGARDFRMMTRQFLNALLMLCEYHRFTKGMFSWIGFDTKWIEYDNVIRAGGETKWSFWKLFMYAVEGIISFTTLPLRLASIVGIIISFFSATYLAIVVIGTLAFDINVPGYASLITIILFLGGLQLLSLGIIGEYISRIYLQTKKRPIFITKETNVNKIY